MMKYKKVFLSFTLSILMLFVLTACSSAVLDNETEHLEQDSNMTVSLAADESDDVEETENDSEDVDNNSNILIAYFTWADNTFVENPAEIDVDATTSASVLPPGNTAKIAQWIHESTGGDMFSIVTVDPYPSDYDECLDEAADEKAQDARPQLKDHIENMDDYDIIYLGLPNWWYTAPMAIFTFIEEYDLSGKTIIPFVAHGTGGLARSVRDITAKLPNSIILEPFGVYRPDVDTAEDDVNEWLRELGMIE